MKKICCISDTHFQHEKIKIEPCDILIHSGDMDIQSLEDIDAIDKWFGEQPAKHVIAIPGNHDRFLESEDKYFLKNYFKNCNLLIHDLIKIEELWIFGSPYSPAFNNWAFEYQRCSKEAKAIWSSIPNNLDILVTHGPSYGMLDENPSGLKCGCEVMARIIQEKTPKYHIYGHIHGFGGLMKLPSVIDNKEVTTFINCSVLNEDYKVENNPIYFEI